MSGKSGNGVWKWIAVVLGSAAVTVGLLMYTGTQAKIDKADAQILEAVKEVKMATNLHDSAISRLNTIGAVNNQWQQMIEKKVDLILKKLQISEHQWPTITADTAGTR